MKTGTQFLLSEEDPILYSQLLDCQGCSASNSLNSLPTPPTTTIPSYTQAHPHTHETVRTDVTSHSGCLCRWRLYHSDSDGDGGGV